MKCIGVFFLSAAALCAADFATGQAARLVIGQLNFTNQDAAPSDVIVGGVSGLAYAADTLFVADSNRVGSGPSNHRVLMYQGLSGIIPEPSAQLNQSTKCPACVGRANIVLGQPDFSTTTVNLAATRANLRTPTAVASDGVHLVVADTDHNRILIWNRIPAANNTPADVVVGQPDFTSTRVPISHVPSATTMVGPEGVWIQNGKLYVADTMNNRVLIYNKIPTTNGAAADVVLGQPDFTTYVQVDLTAQKNDATAANLLNPVSVTSDGQRLYVADLGHNRVLIWNSIPTTNNAPANAALGQVDLNTSISNNAYTVDTANNNKQTPVMCKVSNGTDTNSNPTYPDRCNYTMSMPRFALAAGNRLFVADGGNDRVLVYNTIPTASGVAADTVIGQLGGDVNQASDAADSLRTPLSLAWDGTNLYVSDAYNRRITVYSIGENSVPYQGVRNAASLDIVATDSLTVSGTIKGGDVITVTVAADTSATAVEYQYKVQTSDTLDTVLAAIVDKINAANDGAGDPLVRVILVPEEGKILFLARKSGSDGNSIAITAKTNTHAVISAVVASGTLAGGADAAKIGPGSLVTIMAASGATFAFDTAAADLSQDALPTELAGAQVYLNGIRSPLLYVSPTQINVQVPFEVADSTSVSAYVRSVRGDGSIVTTTPVAITIVPANPGIFTYPGTTNPLPGVLFHGSSYATGVVSVDGSAIAGDVATINIRNRAHSYTVQTGDTLDVIRDSLISAINADDPEVRAYAAGVFDRIILKARVEGPVGNGIVYSIGAGTTGTSSASVTLTTFTSALCCANVAYAPITRDNPAVAGETIIVYATGLGVPLTDENNQKFIRTGVKYPLGSPVTAPTVAMNSMASAMTANVLQASLKPGTVGVYEVLLQLSEGMSANPFTTVDIRQDIYVSNQVTFPLVVPGAAQ
jgi:uncharacterized protein (TIGR03437 family)